MLLKQKFHLGLQKTLNAGLTFKARQFYKVTSLKEIILIFLKRANLQSFHFLPFCGFIKTHSTLAATALVTAVKLVVVCVFTICLIYHLTLL